MSFASNGDDVCNIRVDFKITADWDNGDLPFVISEECLFFPLFLFKYVKITSLGFRRFLHLIRSYIGLIWRCIIHTGFLTSRLLPCYIKFYQMFNRVWFCGLMDRRQFPRGSYPSIPSLYKWSFFVFPPLQKCALPLPQEEKYFGHDERTV